MATDTLNSKQFNQIVAAAQSAKKGPTAEQVVKDKQSRDPAQEKLNKSTVEMLSRISENTKKALSSKQQQAFEASLSSIDSKFDTYFSNLRSIDQSLDKFLDPKQKVNKEGAEQLRALIKKDEELLRSLNEIRQEDTSFNDQVTKLEKQNKSRVRKEGVAEEEERALSKKYRINVEKVWTNISENAGSLSTEYSKQIGDTVVSAIGGPTGLMIKHALGPIADRLKKSEVFQRFQGKVKDFLFGRFRKKEEEGGGGEATTQVETMGDDTDRITTALGEISEPPTTILKKRLVRESRIKRNEKGRLIDVSNNRFVEENAENTSEALRFMEEQAASGKELTEYTKFMRDKIAKAEPPPAKSDFASLSEKLVEAEDKTSQTFKDIRSDMVDSLGLVTNVSEETVALTALQNKLLEMSQEDRAEALKNMMEGNTTVADILDAEKMEFARRDLVDGTVTDSLERQEE